MDKSNFIDTLTLAKKLSKAVTQNVYREAF